MGKDISSQYQAIEADSVIRVTTDTTAIKPEEDIL